jgi:hypothetical protein
MNAVEQKIGTNPKLEDKVHKNEKLERMLLCKKIACLQYHGVLQASSREQPFLQLRPCFLRPSWSVSPSRFHV